MKLKARMVITLTLLGMTGWGHAASQAKLHVAVYGSGFLVDSQRLVTYGNQVRRVEVKARAQGIAAGETPDAYIRIDQLETGFRLRLDPRTKTFTKERFMAAPSDHERTGTSMEPATLKISRITPTVLGPLGKDNINGYPSQSYTIRIVADFSDPQTGALVAEETLLEKLWVTDKAPAVEKFRQDEKVFDEALNVKYGAEEANLRWLLREFNRQVLDLGRASEEMEKLRTAYRSARDQIQGVTVRQVVAWTWQPKNPSAPGADMDIPQFVASLAAGLGAPPEAKGTKPLSPSMRPGWVREIEKDFGRSGSMVLLLDEMLQASVTTPDPSLVTVPVGYRASK